jgi:SAM-dependent methyltransferase
MEIKDLPPIIDCLDLGCGPDGGRVPELLQQGKFAIGVDKDLDPNNNAVRCYEKQLLEKAQLVQPELLEDLPLQTWPNLQPGPLVREHLFEVDALKFLRQLQRQSVREIFCDRLLVNCPNSPALFGEIRRVLTPEGLFTVTDAAEIFPMLIEMLEKRNFRLLSQTREYAPMTISIKMKVLKQKIIGGEDQQAVFQKKKLSRLKNWLNDLQTVLERRALDRYLRLAEERDDQPVLSV